MMILESGEICPYSHHCPLNNPMIGGSCFGSRGDRKNTFECEYVVDGKLMAESGYRNPLDKTGRMKVIME